jgi:hypothetical protein
LHVGDVIDPATGRIFQKFCLHPLALPFPLFATPVRQSGATQRRREWEVPQPIERSAFNADIDRYYGAEKSVLVELDGEPIGEACVIAAALDWDTQPLGSLPEPGACQGDHRVFIDVERGRLVLEQRRLDGVGPGCIDPARLRVTYHYGFSANIGGGPYGRTISDAWDARKIIRVSKCGEIDTLAKALQQRTGPCTIIRIMDSAIYEEGSLYVSLHHGEEIFIEAADGARPCIKGYLLFDTLGDLDDAGSTRSLVDLEDAPPISRLRLSGLLVKAYVLVEGRLRLEIDHCTMVADPDGFHSYGAVHAFVLSYFLEIDIRNSIVGSIRINEGIKQLRIRDSVVDATLGIPVPQGPNSGVPTAAICGLVEALPGPEVLIERSTILGNVHVRAMPLASESIFMGRVHVIRKQDGCMRYCYVDASIDSKELELSRTPRRFRCQPDLALMAIEPARDETQERETRARVRRRLTPAFCSLTYGHPSYGRLASLCPEEIRNGAENGSEMGAFSHLMEPQREANVREAVRRYLPFGLEMNILYADEETNHEG